MDGRVAAASFTTVAAKIRSRLIVIGATNCVARSNLALTYDVSGLPS